jgi:hypothetical protein
MHKNTPDGTAKLMLHTYIGLLEEQARNAGRRVPEYKVVEIA